MIKLGIVMDPIDSINIKKDTSFAMLLEAQRRGYELHYMEMNDLYLHAGDGRARTRRPPTGSVQRHHRHQMLQLQIQLLFPAQRIAEHRHVRPVTAGQPHFG